MYRLSPSLLAADFWRLGEQISEVERAGAEYLHIDVMDGSFVPCISFGTPVIASIRKQTGLVLDVHLMVREPERLIADFAEAGSDIITVHAEACTHLHRTISKIKEYGKKACVALNPATPLNVLDYILPDLDMILIMLVNPGYGGQKLIPAAVRKLRQLREQCAERGLAPELEVDGGAKLENTKELLEAGAGVIVAGTAVFEGNIGENVRRFHEIFAAEAKR